MGLSNELSREGESFSCHCNPLRFLQSEVLRFYFPVLVTCLAPSLFLLVYLHKCGITCSTQSASHHLATSPLCPGCKSPPLPTSLNECFFFNSMVVRLPYILLFWKFWLFFVFKFVVDLLLVVQGGKVYLPMPPS